MSDPTPAIELGDTPMAPGKTGDTPIPSEPGLSFEDATRRLAQIVAELESGELPLDRSLSLFEEGVRLARGAEQRLDRAERRIEELLGFDAQGKPRVRELGV